MLDIDIEQREARVLDRESNRLSSAEGRRIDAFWFAESAGHRRYAIRIELVEAIASEHQYVRLAASNGGSVLAEVPRGTTLSVAMEMLRAAFPRIDEAVVVAGDAIQTNVYGDDRSAASIADCAAAIEKLTEYFDDDGELSDDAKAVCALARAELGPLDTLECLWADVRLREAIIEQCHCECEPWQRGDRMMIDISAARRRVFESMRERCAG